MRSSFLSWRSTSSITGLGILALWAFSLSCAISSASSLPSPSSDWMALSCWRRKNSRWRAVHLPLGLGGDLLLHGQDLQLLGHQLVHAAQPLDGVDGLQDLLRALHLEVEVATR